MVVVDPDSCATWVAREAETGTDGFRATTYFVVALRALHRHGDEGGHERGFQINRVTAECVNAALRNPQF